MAQIGLDGASVVAVVGELEPAGMPQHRNGPIRLHLGAPRAVVRSRISAHGCQGGRGCEIHVPRAFPPASRRSLRSARLSRADIGCTLASPLLALRTMQAPSGEVNVVPAQCHQLRGPKTVAVSDQDSRGASRCPERFCLAASMSRSTSRSVRYSRLRWPTVTFTAVGAASRRREFSMETALPPVHTVTDLEGRVTDLDGCSSPAPPDIAGGSAGKS
jgi:hypothetical protein